MSCGLIGPSVSRSPARTALPSCTCRCLPCGIWYSRASPSSLRTISLRMPRETPPNSTATVDLGHDRRVLGTPRLEQLRHARQTARDVAGLGRLAPDLDQHVARRHRLAVAHLETRAGRQRVVGELLAGRDPRMSIAGCSSLLRSSMMTSSFSAGGVVDLVAHRDLVLHVDEAHGARLLGDDRRCCRCPTRTATARPRPSGRRLTNRWAP